MFKLLYWFFWSWSSPERKGKLGFLWHFIMKRVISLTLSRKRKRRFKELQAVLKKGSLKENLLY